MHSDDDDECSEGHEAEQKTSDFKMMKPLTNKKT